MDTRKKLDLEAAFERELVWTGGGSVRYLVARVTAPPRTKASKRVPLNLAIVVDRSGSMAGGQLEAAIRAGHAVVDALIDGDRISVVAFDDEVRVPVSGLTVGEGGRRRAREALSRLEPGGLTNLSGGWLAGAECLARLQERLPGASHRVLLLSDGHANQGILDAGELGEHARELCLRGIHSSTVGIGDGYSPEQLQAIAENGGGRMHDAEHAEEIEEVVAAELGEILETEIEDIVLEVEVPQGARMECMSAYRSEGVQALRIHLGSLLPGTSREALFQVSTPRGNDGDALRFPLRASSRFREDGDRILSPIRTARLEFAEGARNDRQEQDPMVAGRVVDLWLTRLVQELGRLNREGDPRAAESLDRREGRWFVRFATGIPGAEDAIARYRYLADRARRPIPERLLKEMQLRSYKMGRGEVDRRHRVRGDFVAGIMAFDEENG